MTISPAILDAMLAAGCSAEQIVAAVKADHAEQESRKEAKRAGNAERQQRFRDRRKDRKVEPRNSRNASNALRGVTPPIDNTHTPQTNISSDEESQSVERDDCEAVVESWNDTAKPLGLPVCQKLSPQRRKACQARLRDDGLSAIQQAIQRVPGSAFLRGEVGDWSGANIDFLLRPDTVTKILEGKYDDRNRNSAQPGNVRSFGRPRDGAIAVLQDELGLGGSPGAYRADDPERGAANRQRALAGPRRLFG